MAYLIEPIGLVESCFKQKFGVPRQPGLVPSAQGIIKMLPPFNNPDAFTGLEGCSHLWLQFIFHQNKHTAWQPKVRPPRLGGNASIGVFASRSPYRPNALGLSVVALERLDFSDGVNVVVSGLDLVDGTPIVDIKPYVPYADNLSHAQYEFAAVPPVELPVSLLPQCETFCHEYLGQIGVDLKTLICEMLAQDPRPQYQSEITSRIYGTQIMNVDVRWRYVAIAREGEHISDLDSEQATVIEVVELHKV